MTELALGYTTNDGDITAVVAEQDCLVRYKGRNSKCFRSTVSELAADSVTLGESADNDTTLMTSAAINDRIESFGYTTNGDIQQRP